MPNTTVRAAAIGLPLPPRSLAKLIERERLRSRIEAAVARLIDALDAIDAAGTDLEETHDAEDDPADAEPSLGSREVTDQRHGWVDRCAPWDRDLEGDDHD